MIVPLPPDLVARLDQESAGCNEILDDLVENTRRLLADVADPNVAAQLIAIAVEQGVEPERRSTALGYALVRLARLGGEPQ